MSGGYAAGAAFRDGTSYQNLASHAPTSPLTVYLTASQRRPGVVLACPAGRAAAGRRWGALRGDWGRTLEWGATESGTSGGGRPHCRSVALDAGTRTEWSAWGVGRVCARRLGVGRRECKKNSGATSDDVVALVALASALATPPSLAPCFFSPFACKEKCTHTHTCPHHLPNEDPASTLSLSPPLSLTRVWRAPVGRRHARPPLQQLAGAVIPVDHKLDERQVVGRGHRSRYGGL